MIAKPQLLLKSPIPGLPETFDLVDPSTTVGRHPSNNVVLPFESVSRFHARIDVRGDHFIVQDLNSSNGSYVNNERITQMTVHHGDSVTFGNIEFVFSNESARSGASTAGELRGKSIVDILDDQASPAPSSQSIRNAEEVSKEKSSVISSGFADRRADKNTLLKLNTRLRCLYSLSEILRESADEEENRILEKVLEVIFESIPADRGVVLTRFSLSAESLDVAAVKYRDQPIVPTKVQVSRTILEKVIRDRVAILSKDAMSDARFDASESIVMSGARSTICVPMMMGGKVMGAVHLDTSSTQRSFSEDDLEFVMIIATETGVAIENQRMRKDSIHRARLAAVGETVAGISHNVKNILLLSQGGAELLNRAIEKGDVESARESWGVVRRGIDKIGALVRDMLEYSSNRPPALMEADINNLICSIAEEVEKDLIKKNIMLELDLDESIGPRLLDELGMQRTMLNLIVNAMEAITHNEGRIVITTGIRDDKSLLVIVRDNGFGIPADKLEKIFYPFFTTKGSSGTGLGLPMCKKCIEDMGGTLTVESEENVGTAFIVVVPQQTVSSNTPGGI